MQKRISIFLPTVILILLVLFADAVDSSYSSMYLALLYTNVYIIISIWNNKVPFSVLMLISIGLDSIYGMTLGFSGLIFVIFSCFIKVANAYHKQLGSFYIHFVFFIALGLTAILSIMSKYLLDMQFVNIAYFIGFSIIFYPFVYCIFQTLVNVFAHNEK